MNRALFFVWIACMLVSFTCCEKSYKSGTITFYGQVVDAIDGKPVPTAQISLSSYDITEVSTVTGSDGAYEVDVTLPSGNKKSYFLNIYIKKNEYVDITSEINISRDMDGKRVQESFTMTRKLAR